MRPRQTLFLALGSVVLAGCGAPGAGSAGGGGAESPTAESSSAAERAPEVPGMVVHASDSDVEDTVAAVERGLERVGSVAATIDHAAAAREAGLELDPTVLVVGGDPAAGAAVMVAAQDAGLELPSRFLVWEDGDQVWLGYNSPAFVAVSGGLDADSPFLDTLALDSARIAADASGSEEPVSGEPSEPPDLETYVRTVEVSGGADVDEVLARLQAAFAEAGLGSPASVDHDEQVASSGRRIPATVLTFGGDPEVGTPLMQQAPTMGIDLPLRFLVREDVQGDVAVLHPDYAVLAQRHGLAPAATRAVQEAASGLAAAAAAPAAEGEESSG